MQSMKARLKSNRKVIVDVAFIGETPKTKFYKDKEGKVYPEDMLEFKEYYGG